MVSVIIPALNESSRIRWVVEFARRASLVNEVIVVDDGSVDGTPQIARHAGARVITSGFLGKGTSMEDGLRASKCPIVVYLDGDLAGLDEGLVEKMCRPLLDDQADFVKACFRRKAGRVTALTARPLLQVFFPEYAHFTQPLGGIIAAKRETLERLKFETDYGVDLGLLLDAGMSGARLAEVDIGHLEHESQSLDALGQMAKQVVRTLITRANRYGRLSIEQVQEVEEVERHMNAEFSRMLDTIGTPQRIALFDMDGTLIRTRFVEELARRTGKVRELAEWLDHSEIEPAKRAHGIAALFRGVPKSLFEEIAKEVPVTPGAAETIVALRKAGYRVGIVTDSYRVAAEILRRRVFADFSVANLLRFESGVCSGEFGESPLFLHPHGCEVHHVCKKNVALHLLEKLSLTADSLLAVGDNRNDICMLGFAGTSVAFEPKTRAVEAAGQHVVTSNMQRILELLPHPVPGVRRGRKGSIEQLDPQFMSASLANSSLPV